MYRPLLLVTLALNYACGEYEPPGYHLVNLLFHICNSVLLWVLAARLGAGRGEALLAALLFVVHPMATEPVNYISSRSSLMAAFCCLSGMVLLTRPHSRGIVWIASISAWYLGGLASKAVATSFPVIVAVYLWGRSRLRYMVPTGNTRGHHRGLYGRHPSDHLQSDLRTGAHARRAGGDAGEGLRILHLDRRHAGSPKRRTSVRHGNRLARNTSRDGAGVRPDPSAGGLSNGIAPPDDLAHRLVFRGSAAVFGDSPERPG